MSRVAGRELSPRLYRREAVANVFQEAHQVACNIPSRASCYHIVMSRQAEVGGFKRTNTYLGSRNGPEHIKYARFAKKKEIRMENDVDEKSRRR